MNWPTTLLSLGVVFLLANPALSDPTLTSAAHEPFLKHVDAALASREARQIAAVSDTRSWREAGYPQLDALKMTPPRDRSFATEISPILRSFIKTRLRHVTCNGYGDQ
jgi:hypothetical protein